MDLQNKMVAILIAPKFHEEEAASPAAFLREHGAEVRFIGLQRGNCPGKTNSSVLTVDSPITEVQAGEFDGLVIPGGAAPETLRQNKDVLAFVKAMMEAGKPVAAICHGPQVLISARVAAHRKMTCYPGIRDDLVNAGAFYEDQPVVVDGNLVTARIPQDLPAFNQAFGQRLAHYDRDLPWMNANPAQALEFAIMNEIKAWELYESLAKRTKDRLAKAKFRYLAETERSHQETLTRIFEKVFQGRKPEPKEFPGSPEATQNIDPDGDILKILRSAIAAEEAAHRLYHQIAGKVLNRETQKVFQRLSEEELQHRSLLEAEYFLHTGAGIPSAVEKEPWWSQDLW